MAAPTPGTRTTPAGTKLKRGYRILVCIESEEDIALWERDVKPPGFDGGEMIDTTTQWNEEVRTMVPAALKTMTPMTFKAAWDPAVMIVLQDLINEEKTITVPMPDGSSICFYGCVQKAEPDETNEKNFPTMSVTIAPTNQDPTTGDEELAVYTPPSGTP